jgi:glycosyltransferase involved in cell wall biosynthesis
VGGIPEMVVDGETGWLSALFDVETLSNGILQYLSEDDSKSLEMREKSRQAAVEYYDQLNVARRYAELYKRVLK